MAVDLNAIKAEFNRLKSDGQSNFLDNFVPMPENEGSVVIRLLPPKGNARLPFVCTRTHKMNGKNIHCPMNLVGGKWVGNCPICNYYRSLWKQSETASEEEAKALQAEARSIKPVERSYWNAIVRKVITKGGEVQYNVGPKIFSCGKQLQSKILRAMTGDEVVNLEGLGNVTDISGEEGRDLNIIKRMVKGSGDEKYPNYNDSLFLNPSVCGEDDNVETWLENLHDLEALRRLLPNEELSHEVRIHRGLEQDPDLNYDANDSVEVERPVPVTKRPSVTAQVQRPVVAQNVPKAKPPVMKPAFMDDSDEALADDDFLNKLKGM